MKRKLFTLATIVICLSILAGGTFANFTTEGTAHNVITSGKVDVALLETTDEKDEDGNFLPFKDVSGVMPGREVSKIVEVKNVGTEPAYVRVLVEKEICKDSLPTNLDTGVIDIGSYEAGNWRPIEDGSDNWIPKEIDGKTYYYYHKALTAGQKTEPLFDKVTFDPEMDNNYQNSKAFVNVYVMAVQKANNDENVFEADGWPDPQPQQ